MSTLPLFLAILASTLVAARLFLWIFEWVLGMSLDGPRRILIAALVTLALTLLAGIQAAGLWIALPTSLMGVGAWTYVDLAKWKHSLAAGEAP
jgi:hypothetical protein